FNVLMYKRYGQEIRLSHPWVIYSLRWGSLIRRSPSLLRKQTRIGWIRTLGWQIGLLHGAIVYHVPPVF
ncbi:MAG: hypothetical protein ACREQV_18575, partial [Candidatus Binatia bacterium]